MPLRSALGLLFVVVLASLVVWTCPPRLCGPLSFGVAVSVGLGFGQHRRRRW